MRRLDAAFGHLRCSAEARCPVRLYRAVRKSLQFFEIPAVVQLKLITENFESFAKALFHNELLIMCTHWIFYFAGQNFGLQWGIITPVTDLEKGPVYT